MVRFSVLTLFVVIGFGLPISASANETVNVLVSNKTSVPLTKIRVAVGKTTPAGGAFQFANCWGKKKIGAGKAFKKQCKSAPNLKSGTPEDHAVRVNFVMPDGAKCRVLKPDSVLKKGKGFKKKETYRVNLKVKDLKQCAQPDGFAPNSAIRGNSS